MLYLSLLINVKMPTIVGILTFISMINTTSESLKARKAVCFFAWRPGFFRMWPILVDGSAVAQWLSA